MIGLKARVLLRRFCEHPLGKGIFLRIRERLRVFYGRVWKKNKDVI